MRVLRASKLLLLLSPVATTSFYRPLHGLVKSHHGFRSVVAVSQSTLRLLSTSPRGQSSLNDAENLEDESLREKMSRKIKEMREGADNLKNVGAKETVGSKMEDTKESIKESVGYVKDRANTKVDELKKKGGEMKDKISAAMGNETTAPPQDVSHTADADANRAKQKTDEPKDNSTMAAGERVAAMKQQAGEVVANAVHRNTRDVTGNAPDREHDTLSDWVGYVKVGDSTPEEGDRVTRSSTDPASGSLADETAAAAVPAAGQHQKADEDTRRGNSEAVHGFDDDVRAANDTAGAESGK